MGPLRARWFHLVEHSCPGESSKGQLVLRKSLIANEIKSQLLYQLSYRGNRLLCNYLRALRFLAVSPWRILHDLLGGSRPSCSQPAGGFSDSAREPNRTKHGFRWQVESLPAEDLPVLVAPRPWKTFLWKTFPSTAEVLPGRRRCQGSQTSRQGDGARGGAPVTAGRAA